MKNGKLESLACHLKNFNLKGMTMKFRKYKNALYSHIMRQKQNIGEVIEFEIYYRLAAMLLAQPIISFLFHYLKKTLNESYFNLDALKTLIYKPFGIFLVLLMFIWMTLFASVEISGLLMIIYNKRGKKRLSFRNLIRGIGYDLYRLLKFKNFPMIFWIFFSFILTGNISTYLKPVTIPGFILIGIEEKAIYTVAFLIFNLWILHLYVSRSFIFITFFHENLDYKEALVKSKRAMKGHFFKVLFLLMINGFFLSLVTDVILTSMTLFSQSVIGRLENSSILPLVLAFHRITIGTLPFFKSIILVTGNLLLIQSLYSYYAKKNDVEIIPEREILPEPKYRKSFLKNRKKFVVIGFVIYLLGLSLILQDYLQEGFDLGGGNISITAHRGNGYYYPENSLEGINQAFFSGADYVEIDVQLSKDKVPILLHDKSFSRTTGVNKRPDEMTLEEIKSLDGGIYLGEEFKNTKIPTLEEVIKEFHGRTKLNIELKPYSQDPKELSQMVVKVIKENKFENQCIITSLNKECLKEVKNLDPQLETGYIDIFFSGSFDSLRQYDAFILEETFLTSELVDLAHDNNIKVIVWTVNDYEKMDKLMRMGVDNIITDHVHLALSRRSYFKSTSTTLKAIQKIMYNIWQ